MNATTTRFTEVVYRCANDLDVGPDKVLNGNGSHSVADARHLVAVVCRDVFGMTAREIAEELGCRHRSTVTNAWTRMDHTPDYTLQRLKNQITDHFRRRYPRG